MIDVTPAQMATIQRILAEQVPDCEVRAFGSRVTWTAKDYSDLDLAVVGPSKLESKRLGKLKEAFEESDLPFRVDVIDWHGIAESFRKVIEGKFEVIRSQEDDSGGVWPVLSLREAKVSLIDCDHRTPASAGAGYPYVAIPQLKQGRIDLSDVRRITAENFQDWTKKAKPAPHDVVLSRRCNPGETAYVPPGLEFAVGQNLVLLRADGTKVFPPFLRWLVRGPEWWEQIQRFLNVGAVFDSLKCADIPNFRLRIPPMPAQRAIAHILGTLDDKIELNRRQNETLEAMARALFKSWFVDFDPVRAKAEGRDTGLPENIARLFPDSFEDSELGEIPQGWKAGSLKELTTKIGSGATPRGGKGVYVEEGIAFIRSQNVYDAEFVWDGLAYINERQAGELSNAELVKGDVLLNITGASILRTCIVEPSVLPARVNQHVAIIRAKTGIPNRFLHLHLLQKATKDYLLGMNAGGSREGVTKGHIESVPILVPPQSVLTQFQTLEEAWFQKAENNMQETRSLIALCDCLLPKLLSGELGIEGALRLLDRTDAGTAEIV